ncbi:MAG: HpcH/HpaI aldolase/citrate lyase family protein [Planctomycetes bacterium]|nr:HpcH/HpaI aldolase/citrate lyase family protein [Planctomycetota bacterium]
MIEALQLGASLYVPATRADLLPIGNRRRYPNLRSVIFCTEDAIGPGDVHQALSNVEQMLPRLEPSGLMRFVRVRNAVMLRQILQMDGARNLTGFVIPKATRHNLDDYLSALAPDDPYQLMPILETAEVFDPAEMTKLRDLLLRDSCRGRILSLRIGGNDLLQLLGLRRPRARTIYATPLGSVIAQLVTVFRPCGFNLTGPVCEWLKRGRLLARESRGDVARGLFGKSAIHPEQIAAIESAYRVNEKDLESAERILAEGAAPVFRLHDAMCEPATHRAWAMLLHERARLFGVRAVVRRFNGHTIA